MLPIASLRQDATSHLSKRFSCNFEVKKQYTMEIVTIYIIVHA